MHSEFEYDRAAREALGPQGAAYADALCQEGLHVVAPSPTACGHGAVLTLNPALVPDWLREALPSTVQGPEAGYPQLCRVWEHVDWRRLAADHPTKLLLEDDGEDFPTAAALTAVDQLRELGCDAAADAFIFVSGVERFTVIASTDVTVRGVMPPSATEAIRTHPELTLITLSE